MKNIPTLLLFLVMTGHLCAQRNINVLSFSKLENDLDARVNEPLKDQNGDLCAIIKIVTTQTGFSFDCGQIGIVKTVNKSSEIWVYVPYGAKRMTITHPQLGMLRDYLFPIPLEKATVYELVLTSGKIITTIDETIDNQWLLIRAEPAKAMIYLNDQFMKIGEFSTKLKPGKYSFRVEAPLYHTEAGLVEIADSKKELSIVLKPAFGFVNVTTLPEQSATILIDGKEQPQVSPFKSEPLASGEHIIQVIKEMYQTTVQKVLVKDREITDVKVILQPNFAELSVKAPEDAMLFINNVQKGKGQWNGRLNAGVYSLEVQKEKYHPAKQDIELIAGDKKSVELLPTPILGSIDILSTPSGATILVNGKDAGQTPNTVNKLLIGDYSVQLNLKGYAHVVKSIKISEGQNPEINEKMTNGRAVTINSLPLDVELFIDGQASGKTPYRGNLSFGNHQLTIEQNGIKGEKSISVAESGGEETFSLTLGAVTYTETVNGVSFDMVAIKGGTFEMGSDELDNAKPKHMVTVSDFNIGKTEVTQALWKTVMGNKPSNFQGDNLPVEKVSWDTVQIFIRELNQLTGKYYRLPTEAEWEYAASTVPNKGKGLLNRTRFAGTNNENKVGDFAWYIKNSQFKTHPVGQKLPNANGLYDMSGNVSEWCIDLYSPYSQISQVNPISDTGKYRVSHGGCFAWDPDNNYCNVSFRSRHNHDTGSLTVGFRLVGVPLP